jgi:Major Facilitator Superfamily
VFQITRPVELSRPVSPVFISEQAIEGSNASGRKALTLPDPSGQMLPSEPAILTQKNHREDEDEDDGLAIKATDFSSYCIPDDHQRCARYIVPRTVALCICMLTHSYLLISVFPYSGFLAIHLLHLRVESEDSVGPYAGLIAAAFMAGRAVTAMAWGRIADRYGRTFVLYTSLTLSAILSVLFGLASHSFFMALGLRFLLGCSNGIVTAIKTLVSELSDRETEAKIMNIVLGMWGLGFLLSPAISGALAEPVTQYPDHPWDASMMSDVLTEYPFLLPNLVAAAACLLSLLSVPILPETLPLDQRTNLLDDFTQLALRFFRRSASYRYGVLATDNDDAPTTPAHEKSEESASMMAMFSDPNIRGCLLLMWAFSFVELTFDESFPLFCLSHKAGFGLPENEIGKVLSMSGLLFVICQYWVYSWLDQRLGLYGSIKASLLAAAPTLLLLPLSLPLNSGAEPGTLRWVTFLTMASLLALFRCFASAFFSCASVAANRSVTSSNRAALNSLSILGGSVTKSMGPAISGLLMSISVSLFGTSAGLVVFLTIGSANILVFALAMYYFPGNDPPFSDEGKMEMVKIVEMKKSLV